ncbi:MULTISPECIES: branched-chain amino acid ABC transporter permease [Paenibacillus]|uniref:ABC transporter n=1 Tax=Paenibacillus naphthalenovorans TaxID=162209 RepID=A0A0U2INB7_9BACL|nr:MULTISPECIES: branched-chain amino acid ABC transporter permease [Paenibacillus]ALS24315.1 ABC transporter [Paenibacillus naphthalenovorans]GCL73794.1 branched-chain amino acid ABC transporter permease [Paenibacillus naphthalenovorans]SDI53562.1 branched-chain amino acid transport system permease protein [Paenibacillus naphthalenovorans]
MDFLNPYTLQVFTFLFLNLILAISIYITLSTGQLSLGHAGFMSIGAYTASIATKSADLPLIVALILAVIITGIVALIIGYPTLRLHGLYLAIATLGFGEVVRVIMLNLEITNGALGLTGLQSIGTRLYELEKLIGLDASVLGISVSQMKALSTLIAMMLLFIVILLCQIRLDRSRVGRAFSAIRADETAARAMGINITYYKMLAYLIGSMLAGLGGGLYAHITTSITPDDFNYHRAVEILSFAVVGGSEVIIGPLFGAALLTGLPEYLRVLAEYKMIFYGTLLILVMAFRPHGLITASTFAKWKQRKSKTSGKGGL